VKKRTLRARLEASRKREDNLRLRTRKLEHAIQAAWDTGTAEEKAWAEGVLGQSPFVIQMSIAMRKAHGDIAADMKRQVFAYQYGLGGQENGKFVTWNLHTTRTAETGTVTEAQLRATADRIHETGR
jgi:hypothetical protein